MVLIATSSNIEKSFSALKKIKTFCQSTLGQESLNSLAMLTIERNIIEKLHKYNLSFYDYVTEIFLKKERRAEFIYK